MFTKNVLVEGDNLDVMNGWLPEHAGTVDVCYIDPPYNTGRVDLRYADRLGGEWVDFMRPRLGCIRDLLTPTGVLFVSIDDRELFPLGTLLNEVFGRSNHVATLCWVGSSSNVSTRVLTDHEYILCYARDVKSCPPVWELDPPREYRDLVSVWQRICSSHPAPARHGAWERHLNGAVPDWALQYRLVDDKGPYKLTCGGNRGSNDRFSAQTREAMVASGDLVISASGVTRKKTHLVDRRFPLRALITLPSRQGSQEVTRLLGDAGAFAHPKPVNLITMLLAAAAPPDAVVLDAFAGSGTTGHAVMRLNHDDGGTRTFVLIESGHGTDRYASTLTTRRLTAAAEVEESVDGFTVYRWDGGMEPVEVVEPRVQLPLFAALPRSDTRSDGANAAEEEPSPAAVAVMS